MATLATTGAPQQTERVNLHDWIDEVCDVLDLDVELDEALVLDLAREVAHNVERKATPITTFLLGVAAGRGNAGPESVEALAAKVEALAHAWDRPAGQGMQELDELGEADEVPDDSGVDHSGDRYEV